MQPDAYTNDAICSATGIGRFEPEGVDQVVRLLLKPSFHPEACITLEPAQVRVVALQTMLWQQPVPCRMPNYAETFAIQRELFDRAVAAFEAASAENTRLPASVAVDGMQVSALRINGSYRSTFAGQPIRPAQSGFVAMVVQMGLDRVGSVSLRNRLAQCGRYVDNNFELEPEPERLKPTRLLVLGEPQERDSYFAALNCQRRHIE